MEALAVIGGCLLYLFLRGGTPPRYQRLRGAEAWTDADDAQQRHLAHWVRWNDPEPEEGDE